MIYQIFQSIHSKSRCCERLVALRLLHVVCTEWFYAECKPERGGTTGHAYRCNEPAIQMSTNYSKKANI